MVWVTCDGSGGKAAGANPGLEYSLWFDLMDKVMLGSMSYTVES